MTNMFLKTTKLNSPKHTENMQQKLDIFCRCICSRSAEKLKGKEPAGKWKAQRYIKLVSFINMKRTNLA